MLSSAFAPPVLTPVDFNVSNSKTANDLRSQNNLVPGGSLEPGNEALLEVKQV